MHGHESPSLPPPVPHSVLSVPTQHGVGGLGWQGDADSVRSNGG